MGTHTSPSDPPQLTPPPPDRPPLKPQIKRPTRKNKKRWTPDEEEPPTSSSSSSPILHSNYNSKNSCNNYSSSSLRGGIRIPNKRKKSTRLWARRNHSDVEAIAFPLGMSIAAVLAQVLERKDLTNEVSSVEHLSMICTSAVRESLTNVFGDKFDAFASNFEKSFGSTLSTIRVIRNYSVNNVENREGKKKIENSNDDAAPVISLIRGECSPRSSDMSDGCTESVACTFGSQLRTASDAEDNEPTESRNQELSLLGLSSPEFCSAVSNRHGYSSNQSMLSTFQKSVSEQTRANELKSLEIGLIMKKMQLKETQLALNSDSNFLERCKLYLGTSRMSFKVEKFKNQLEESRHGELLKTCADLLVADLLIMSACLGYGVYAFSYEKLRQLTNACHPAEEAKSWWIPKPMSTLNSGLQTVTCQVQVYSRIIFGVMMIFVIGYVLVQRSEISRQAMPITFLVLLLGVGGGIFGKLCVDTLGGDGYHWLMYWELLCMVHFFANVFTPFLFYILNGAVQVSQGTKCRSVFPFWMRRCLFYLLLLLAPVCCGLLPFASARTWWDEHFSPLIRNHMLGTYEDTFDADSFP